MCLAPTHSVFKKFLHPINTTPLHWHKLHKKCSLSYPNKKQRKPNATENAAPCSYNVSATAVKFKINYCLHLDK